MKKVWSKKEKKTVKCTKNIDILLLILQLSKTTLTRFNKLKLQLSKLHKSIK